MITEVAVKQTKRGVNIQQIIQLWKISHSKLFAQDFKNVTTKKLLWHSVEIHEFFVTDCIWKWSKYNGSDFEQWISLIQNCTFLASIWNHFYVKFEWQKIFLNFHTVVVRRSPFTALISKGLQLHTGHKFQKWIDKKSFFNSSVLSIFFRSSIGATFLSVTFFWIINDGLNFIKIVNSKF